MKTIEVSEKMYEKLIQLATEMTTQDPRATRMPHIFQIRDWKRVYNDYPNGDIHIYLDRQNGSEIETAEDLVDYLKNYEIPFEETEIREMWENDRDFGITDWIEENAPELEQYSYSLEPEYTNSFLTAKAAQEHLDINYYHYHPKADVYLNHAWRNPEAELVTEFLCGLVGKKIHT
jgi:hypothetical protein